MRRGSGNTVLESTNSYFIHNINPMIEIDIMSIATNTQMELRLLYTVIIHMRGVATFIAHYMNT